jgi:hypothetical protein
MEKGTGTMKAISIKQPWAWLIVNGYKNIENRSWKTDYRGKLLIHASKQIDYTGYSRVIKNFFPDVPIPLDSKDFNVGGIVGEVYLADIVRDSPSRWAEHGLYHWKVENAKQVPFIQCNGKLSLWNVPENIKLKIKENKK